jgi:glyoxylase I family protein
MAQVTGIGGFFFRAREPGALNRWYAEHFRVVMIESRGYEDPGWFQDRGETVFAGLVAGVGLVRRARQELEDQLPRRRPGRHGRPAR